MAADNPAALAQASVDKLRKLVATALDDKAYAERLFTDPDAIARENGLSSDEALVVRQMNREQFDKATADAAAYSGELNEDDLAAVAGGVGISLSLGVSTNMIVGRSISAATGISFQGLASAGCDCCAWKGGISGAGMVSNPAF